MDTMKPGAIIKAYFGSDGYPPVSTRELIDFAKTDRAGYQWCVDQAANELGVTVDRSIS